MSICLRANGKTMCNPAIRQYAAKPASVSEELNTKMMQMGWY
jgi:hypothetical protein